MKHPIVQIVGWTLVFFISNTVWANPPQFLPGEKIKDGLADITVDYCATPTVVDWNNDGRKDLLIGQEMYGRIWLYLNIGTDLNPHFNGGSLIESGGVPITTTYS
jgi:hypothetical protein